MLLTSSQMDQLQATLANLSGLDAELADQCGPLIRGGRNDDAVARAFVVLEERLRSALGVHGGNGVDLSQRAFAPDKGQLAAGLHLPRGELEGMRDLFVGAFRAYRNRAAHTHAGYDSVRAVKIIHLVDLLLDTMSQVGDVPQHPVMHEIVSTLGPDSTRRLLHFLGELENIGVWRKPGKSKLPYRAMLLYRAPGSTGKAKPKYVTLFYIQVLQDRPVLAFSGWGLSCIVGLDVDRVRSELLKAGCTGYPTKDIPVILRLDEHADTRTFGAVRDVLRGVVERHGT